jgi:alpha-beta hydrolase superfamily lysophospholipase
VPGWESHMLDLTDDAPGVTAPEFFTASDGVRLQVHRYSPSSETSTLIFIAPGITGLNPTTDHDVIEGLAGEHCRVVTIYPRGTGYSEGPRGDVDMIRFVEDFIEGVNHETQRQGRAQKVVLFGHSMSCAVALAAARKIDRVDGMILVNPPYKRKVSKGMTPSVWDYLKYAGYAIFASRTPVIDMAGDPEKITDPLEQAEARQRNADPLLVKTFSLRVMMGVKNVIADMVKNARAASSRLLLVHGGRDSVVDEAGCREIFAAWKDPRKEYLEVPEGPHGKQTVISARAAISRWLQKG